ncbi:hypothetical protein [Desulfonatronovibrio hydrogenovorans]|uniref:hypothetical protein n=1 Tax=Desulfonatronovibrio hydrogenovorans TaxID=53245 RepID=UPI000490778D|nr:hypothetical protein [Desulfonatronovibrio hydrogenovorans]
MEEKKHIEIWVEDLCNYALDREDIKWIADAVPPGAGLDLNTLEYELQLLKIVVVGWSISYYLQDEPVKNEVVEPFWKNIHDVSGGLSQATSLLIGKDINYFEIIRSRLDRYVQAMAGAEQGTEPVMVVGPEFAGCLGEPGDLAASMAGSRMFLTATGGVKEYLQTAGFRI